MLHRAPPIHIRAPTGSRNVQHVRGRGTVEEAYRRKSAPLSNALVSAHDCVGDMSTIKPRASRVCVLRRVCMATATGIFHYYRDGNATLTPIVFDQRYGHIFSFGHVAPRGGCEDLLPLNKHVRYKRHVRWSPHIVDGALPHGAPLLRQLHVLSAPFVPTNLGHLVWEEAFPLLLAMAQLGVYEERAVVLRTHNCSESVKPAKPPTASAARLCRKFVDGFVRPLQGGEAAAQGAGRGVASAPLTTIDSLRQRYARAGAPYVCFRRLLAGGYHEMFNAPAHAGKEPLLALYRHRVLAFHGLAPARGPPPPITAHRCLLVKKEGRRGLHNFDEVARFVLGGCDGGCTELSAGGASGLSSSQDPRSLRDAPRVVEIEFHTMSIREQLAAVSSATIAVSPPGGVSMILPFLPEGAHAVLVNYMLAKEAKKRGLDADESACSRCSLTMEAALWRHVRHVRKLYYQVWEPSDFARGKAGRDAAVVVKLPRLSFLLRVALNTMAEAVDDADAEDTT